MSEVDNTFYCLGIILIFLNILVLSGGISLPLISWWFIVSVFLYKWVLFILGFIVMFCIGATILFISSVSVITLLFIAVISNKIKEFKK